MKLLNINLVSQQLRRNKIHCSVCRYLRNALVMPAKHMLAPYKGVMCFHMIYKWLLTSNVLREYKSNAT